MRVTTFIHYLCVATIFLHVSETIRLLHLLRISSGENNYKSKRSDPSKISLVPVADALEILGSQAWGFFYFRKPDIRANQFSDLSRSEKISAFNLRKRDDACYDFYSLPSWSDNFSPKNRPYQRVYREGIIRAIPLFLRGILLVSLIFLCSFLWRS